MAQVRRLDLKNVIPIMFKQSVYTHAWGLSKRKGSQDEISIKFNAIYDYLTHFILHAGIKGFAFFDTFSAHTNAETLIFDDSGIEWTFPRIGHRCITDSLASNGKVALQIVTLGRALQHLIDQLEREEQYSMLFYFHGFSVWLTEALAQYHHSFLHKELKSTKNVERYSFGYPLCPDLSMQKDLFQLLHMNEQTEVSLLPSFMIMPEQSTSSIIFH